MSVIIGISSDGSRARKGDPDHSGTLGRGRGLGPQEDACLVQDAGEWPGTGRRVSGHCVGS